MQEKDQKEPFEDTSSASIIHREEANGNVLRGDEVVAHSSGVFHRRFKHPLCAYWEGNASGRRVRYCSRPSHLTGHIVTLLFFLVVPYRANSFPGILEGDARAKEPVRVGAGLGLRLCDEAEQQVLSEHHVLAQSPGFPLGEDDGFDRPLRESLKRSPYRSQPWRGPAPHDLRLKSTTLRSSDRGPPKTRGRRRRGQRCRGRGGNRRGRQEVDEPRRAKRETAAAGAAKGGVNGERGGGGRSWDLHDHQDQLRDQEPRLIRSCLFSCRFSLVKVEVNED